MDMRTPGFVFVFALTAVWMTTHAAELPPVDEAVEAMTNSVSIPSALGRITVRSCPQCAEHYLNLTSQSKFFVGQQEVAFDDLKKAMNTPAPQFIAVYYREADDSVTRVILTPR